MTSRQPEARRDAEVIGLVGLAHGTSHFFQLLLPPLFNTLPDHATLPFTVTFSHTVFASALHTLTDVAVTQAEVVDDLLA